jgi:hypothetical protein
MDMIPVAASTCQELLGCIKADSHIACRANAVPLPCRAFKGLECVFPTWFTQCGRVWFTLAMLYPCCSPAMLCRQGFRMRLSHLIYTVRPCLIHTCHAAPVPFPCHSVPLRVYNTSFPFDLHSAAVSDLHLPCHFPAVPCRWGFRMCLSHLIYTVRLCLIHTCHAVLWPCRSSQGHGTARPSRDGLWATCPHSASSSYHAEFHEDCYQKYTNPHNDPYLWL